MTSFFITIAVAVAAIVGGVALRGHPSEKISSATTTATSTHATALSDERYPHAEVTIGGKAFDALVADTEELKDLGLGDRKGLEKDQAMLFPFDEPSYLGFWMKDMLFSIDMLWLDADLRVVSFESNVSPKTYPKAFFPPKPAQYVIELSAGALSELGVKAGDKINLSAHR
ncbi:MAG TPA: DUF192 domain-containing protein [Candidatus Paceibacterota bacterium]|nr:DUF192 domain-containing protein [Candidatus Paceibacterota bacterium]